MLTLGKILNQILCSAIFFFIYLLESNEYESSAAIVLGEYVNVG